MQLLAGCFCSHIALRKIKIAMNTRSPNPGAATDTCYMDPRSAGYSKLMVLSFFDRRAS
jgi:hypothetical protein